MFSPIIWKCQHNYNFLTSKIFSWKHLYRHLEFGFNNPAKNFPANGLKTFDQCPKMIKTTEDISKKNLFSSKNSYGHINCSFHNLAHKFSANFEKAPPKVQWWQKFLFFSKRKQFSSKSSYGHLEFSFDKPAENF